jgi:hypothetical protein
MVVVDLCDLQDELLGFEMAVGIQGIGEFFTLLRFHG